MVGNTLGREVRQVRLRRGLTQTDLGRQIGSDQGAVSEIETGARVPTVDILRRIASALDTPYNELAVLAGYLDPADQDRQPAPLPPVILAAWRELERKHPELIPQLEKTRDDPDFAGQIVDLSTALGYVIRGFLGTEIDKPGEG